MKHWNFSSLDRSLTQVNQWLAQSSLQKLAIAYSAAFAIQEIEDKHFDSKSVAFDIKKGKITSDYFQVQLHRELAKVRFNLAQFKLGSFWIKHKLTIQESEISETESLILEQLSFIESVVAKYRLSSDPDSIEQIEGVPTPIAAIAVDRSTEVDPKSTQMPITPSEKAEVDRVQQKTPRSLFRLSQITEELNPEYEQKVIAELRTQRRQTRTAIRWLVILLIVPIVAYTLTKNLVFEPLLSRYSEHNAIQIELNQEIRENFLAEFGHFKQSLEVRQLLGMLPQMTAHETREMLREEVVEIWQNSRGKALNGLTNLLSDGVSFIVFVSFVYLHRDKLLILRQFINRTFLGLSDPTKVLLFILITDLFVGFHSAEGWEVILESIATHFGIPENRTLIYLFIATVPVAIDSCTKFWIFTYFTRYSPTSSAIYERMNK
jgi:CemA family